MKRKAYVSKLSCSIMRILLAETEETPEEP